MPSPCSPFRVAVALLLPLLAAPPSGATTVIAPEFESLVSQSGYIVRAVVKTVIPEWRATRGQPGDRHIVSRIELEVLEAIKGTPPNPLVLEAIGGRIGDDELVIHGTPRFKSGEEAIFFVNARRSFSPLVALQYGLYPVQRDARTGRDLMLRANGRPLYSEHDVALPLAAPSTELLRNPQARPLSSADFAARIRQSVEVAARATQR